MIEHPLRVVKTTFEYEAKLVDGRYVDGEKKIETLADGRTRVTHANGVVQWYLPNGAVDNVDCD